MYLALIYFQPPFIFMFLSLVLLFVIYKTFYSIHFLYFGSQLVTHFHVSIPPHIFQFPSSTK